MGILLTRRVKVQGFIVFDDFGHVYPEFAADMIRWIREGKIKYREHLVEGLENAPAAFPRSVGRAQLWQDGHQGRRV